jgi:Protein of unknown function (DUF3866)
MPWLHLRVAVVREPRTARTGAEEWWVEGDGVGRTAVSYPHLVGRLGVGDRVLVNTTARDLALGTGGVDFVVARLEPDTELPEGSEAGHILKLRYTPLQHAVCSVEESDSPHRAAIERFRSLDGMPVLAAELHSQAAAAAICARALATGPLGIALVVSDTAALPLAFSRLAARLRADGILDVTITAGQAFGGDLEAINVHTALIAAREVAGADLAIVTQGPGNAGTGTAFGFGGLAQGEHLNAAAALGGCPIALPRISFADPRPRHRGLSHHTRSVLERIAHSRCLLPMPVLPDAEATELRAQLAATAISSRYDVRWIDAAAGFAALTPYQDVLTTMGRRVDEDRAFFLAAAAGGMAALALVPGRSSPTQAPNVTGDENR